jgi:predicted ATPase
MSTAPSDEIVNDALAQAKPPFLRRVRIRGYKSIAFCDVTLEPLTILVGRNASGKSNFLDALAFLSRACSVGVREAVKRHGGRDGVLCRLTKSDVVSLEIEAGFLPHGKTEPWTGSVLVQIEITANGPPRVVREQVRLQSADRKQRVGYTVEEGRVTWDAESPVHHVAEWPNHDKLLLGVFGSPHLELFDLLQFLQTYNFSPEAIRTPQKPLPGGFLERDGSNLASVIETTREVEEWAIERAGRYLLGITKTIRFDGVASSDGYETLRFRVARDSRADQLVLSAASMSDGTLRAFAALVAAFQKTQIWGSPSVVAIEEPETSLHPAAMWALVDALDEATLRTQILLTTHSADLLDNPTIKPENVRVVQMIDGRTVIGPVDEASVEIVRQKLDTLGGLERQNQFEPDPDDQERQTRLWRNGTGPHG